MRRNRVGDRQWVVQEDKMRMSSLCAKQFLSTEKLIQKERFFTVEIKMKLLLAVLFIFMGFDASCATANAKLDSCIANFCLFKPMPDREFVERFGKGGVRFDADDRSTYFRCFYLENYKMWIEFQFDEHTSSQPEIVSVFVTQSKLCSKAFTPHAPMELGIKKEKTFIGMSESELFARMGAARIEPLLDKPKNSIFDRKFGDNAYIYEANDSVLYGVIYIRNSRVVGCRLSVEE